MKDISSSKNFSHYPVMLNEVMKLCSPENGGNFIDCTFGSGGYSDAILSFKNTKVISLDRDSNTIDYASEIKKKYNDRFIFYNEKFSNLDRVIKKDFKADFIIFDLGISSMQIFNLDRGFSFKSKSNVDMRMGLNSISAQDVLNKYDFKKLKNIIKYFGDEKESSRIASNIIKEREKSPINSIPRLVEIIEKSKKKNYKKKINICTQTFQAIRIFVNKEISELVSGLIQATKFLKKGGKLVLISFHSLEDKIIKFYFTNYSKNKSKGSRYYPQTKNDNILFENYKNKIIRPTVKEINENNPSRSAKLRYATRSKDNFFYPEELKKRFINYLNLESENV
tara:strand:+ start:2150 stop:3163 length:1014 start_codon:yes stop_codon:yes gene_type:complete